MRLKRQRFDVAFAPINIHFGNAGIFPSPLQQLWSEIKAGYICTDARRSNGNDSSSASHIEHTLAGLDAGKLHQARRGRRGH